MANLPVNRIKKKNIMSYHGDLCIVLECVVRTPPNNASYVQMELRSIKTGAKIPVRCGIGVSFEVFDNSIKQLELSYQADGNYVFSDPNTFEEYYVSEVSLEESKEFLIPGTSYMVLFVEEKPVTVDLPPPSPSKSWKPRPPSKATPPVTSRRPSRARTASKSTSRSSSSRARRSRSAPRIRNTSAALKPPLQAIRGPRLAGVLFWAEGA